MDLKQAIALCLILFPLLTLQSTAFIYPFENENQNSVSEQIDEITQHQVAQLVKYNLGLLEHTLPDQAQSFKSIIKQFGKGNLFTPTQMTYMMVIESNKLIAEQENKQARITEGYSDTVSIVQKSEKSVLDILFSENDQSLVRRASKLYKSDEEPNLPFIIYQNEDDLDINYLEWTVTLYIGSNNEVFFYEPRTDKSFKVEQSLEKCVDFFFGTTFDYSPADDKIYKYNTNDLINITPENQDLFMAFFKDICAMNKLSSIFKPGKSPNFLSIINKSVARLEKNLKEEEITLVYDMMRIAHKKMSKNLRNYFNSDDLFGIIMIEEEKSPKVTTTKEAAKMQRILMETKNRMLDQTSATTFTTTAGTMTPGVYQMFLWFGIFMIFVTFGVLYSLITMDIQKDTLLYAKFITTDQRN